MNKKILFFSLIVIFSLFFTACGPQSIATILPPAAEPVGGEEIVPPADTAIPPTETPVPDAPPAPLPSPEPTDQPVGALGDSGPQIGDFPPGVNPLTGLPVSDPSMLTLPAVLISIPMFPASGRPQAGVSFSPWIFEIYIGEGMTRLLATFYGELPTVEAPLSGSCAVNTEPFTATDFVLGNRAWWDQNGNGVQDPQEPGIGGICVTLFNSDGVVVQTTSTDSNGYYGFDVDPSGTYRLGFEHPALLGFTAPDVGLDDTDSDPDPNTGQTSLSVFSASDMNWDAGYISPAQTAGAAPLPNQGLTDLPPAEVGPIRSMRLPYGTIGKFFAGGCIVSASGDPSVLARVPGCKYAAGDDSDINGTLLDITDLYDLAVQNQNPIYPVNYSGNLFSTTPPAGGTPANQVNVYWNEGNQSQFRFDPLSGAYQRFANLPTSVDAFTPQTDRLTGQQLLYDNVIVLFVEHKAYAETMIDINLGIGDMGHAILFRDGQIFKIYWSTVAQEYEQATQRLRPLRFTDAAGNPIALKPGHTWVNVFTPASGVYEKVPGSGVWTARFSAPVL